MNEEVKNPLTSGRGEFKVWQLGGDTRKSVPEGWASGSRFLVQHFHRHDPANKWSHPGRP